MAVTVDINEDPNFLTGTQRDPRDPIWPTDIANDNAIINEYYCQLSGISEALDSVAILEELQQKLENTPDPSPGMLRVVAITVEHLRSSLDIEVQGYSLESFKTGKEVALEGLGKMIAAFFNAILNAIAAVIDFIAGLFGGGKKISRDKKTDERKKKIKEIQDRGAPRMQIIKAQAEKSIFKRLDPFHEKTNDQLIIGYIEEATKSCGCVSATVKLLAEDINKATRILNTFISQPNDDQKSEFDDMMIALCKEWTHAFKQLGPTHSVIDYHKERLTELKADRELPGNSLEDTFAIYGFFSGGYVMAAYDFPAIKKKYAIRHFTRLKPDDDKVVATGLYEADDWKVVGMVAQSISLYSSTSDELAGNFASTSSSLIHLKDVLKKVEAKFAHQESYRITPMLHIAKGMVQQMASFCEFLTMVDHTGNDYDLYLETISKNFSEKKGAQS